MFRVIGLGCLSILAAGAIALTGSGLLLEGPQPPLERSDAIIVISGDEASSRVREGVRLFRNGWASTLILSGAAEDGVVSNAKMMEEIALEAGIPSRSILLDPDAMDTFGNAVYTRQIMLAHGFKSAILVTSPYHLHRAGVTFRGVYEGSGVRIIPHAAPDSEWRKVGWWNQPETRRLTFRELERMGYIFVTGRYN
jgi:uncharacterized SAM-binding protein YcdF (DUF218 family)